MKLSSIPEKEAERIETLYQLQILDTAAEQDFDNIVTLASHICETPISMIAFLDEKRLWFKAKSGIDLVEIPRDIAFCFNDMQDRELIIIPDAGKDERFFDNPLVTGKPGIRFYAAMPIITEEGFLLGHLCVADQKPRTLSPKQLSGLQILSEQVVRFMELRLQALKTEKAEQEATSSEELINTIFHNAIDAVIVIDDEGIIMQWNPKAETLFGWTAREAIGKSFSKLVIPEQNREAHMKALGQDEKLDGDSNIIELSAHRKNNTEFEISLGISPTTIKGQRYYICFVSDITERKLATKQLDKQKEFYESILNTIPTDIAVFDAQHRYLFVNPGAIKNAELRQYIIGKDDFEYCEFRKRDKSIAQSRRERFLEVKNAGKEIVWEETFTMADGSSITHLRRMFPAYNERGDLIMVIGYGVDISERKVMEEKKSELVKQLSVQNTQLIDFCNIVSHNLRGPLVNLSMLVKLIESSEEEYEQNLLISKLNPVIQNLNTTFNELVESIQVKQDQEIQSEKIILRDYLQRALDGLAMEINKSDAVIDTDFDEAPVINYPPKYLSSILHNLVSNALKYQSPNRKPVITLTTKKIDGNIILSVKDNCLGIDLVRHKDNFFKIGKVFHRHPNAKGFGLFMTKTQVEAMNGRIWVESMPDKGSTFFVEFVNQNV